MALKIKSTKVTEDIVDENNNVIGKVSFDPEDPIIYKKYLHLVDIIEEKQKIDKKLGSLENIPDFDLKNIEEFEKYKEIFKKIGQKLDNYLETMEEIKNTTDEIFGNVSETFEKITNSIDPYIELIKWANSYFKEKRTAKVEKYLDKEEEIL